MVGTSAPHLSTIAATQCFAPKLDRSKLQTPSNSFHPQMSSTYAATMAAKELTHALLNPAPAAPFATIGDAQLVALKQLTQIFQLVTNKHPTTASASATDTPTITTPQRVMPLQTTASHDNQPHVIPNDNGISSTPPMWQTTASCDKQPHVIPWYISTATALLAQHTAKYHSSHNSTT
jgi:hypothetical protein